MKVLQLIDSLHAGGAERMAVNLANVLADKVDRSFICATRQEGVLKQAINKDVGYLFLNKTSTLDIRAIKTLNTFVKHEAIDVLHAHSTSFFLATLVKLLNKNLKLVWHDHYGQSEFLEHRKTHVLQYCSNYFSHIFSVNEKLETWAQKKLKAPSVSYLSNFIAQSNVEPQTSLKGFQGKRLVCMANLRPQKDHIVLLHAFSEVIKTQKDWTLHLVGKDFRDAYSKKVKAIIRTLNLESHVFLYGSRPDVGPILKQCEIGVLSSKSEGLPLALLEYGLAGLAVVATKVGQCDTVLEHGKLGVLVAPQNSKALQDALEFLIDDVQKRQERAAAFHKSVVNNYASEAIVETLLNTYKTI